MSEIFQIVSLDPGGRPRLRFDLETHGSPAFKLRDSLRFTPGAPVLRYGRSDAQYGGGRAHGGGHENGAITVTVVVTGSTHEEAAANVELLLAAVAETRERLYVRWQPDGLARSVLHEIRGPGSWQPNYAWAPWFQNRALPVEITFPVEPIPRGLCLDVYDDFRAPADALRPDVNLLPNPSFEVDLYDWVAGGTVAPFATRVQTWAHAGRWALNLSHGAVPSLGSVFIQNDTIAVGAGETLTFLYTARMNAAHAVGVRLFARTHYYNTSGGLIGASNNEEIVDLGAATPGQVIPMVNTEVVPMGTTHVNVAAVVENGTGSAKAVNVSLDAFMLAPGVPGEYGDGDQPLFRWESVPHRSRSVQLAEPKLAEYGIGAGQVDVVSVGSLVHTVPA
jgi:hypothetical protein